MRLSRSMMQFLLLAVVLVACTPQTEAVPSVTPASPPATARSVGAPVTITGQADGAPSGCRPAQIADQLRALLQAWTMGDSAVIPTFFGTKDGAPFQWYSLDAVAVFTLTDLTQYVSDRGAQHEQMQLQAIQFNGWDPARSLVHFGPLRIIRTADDLPPGPQHLHGKGAYHCGAHRFVVLSLATSTGP